MLIVLQKTNAHITRKISELIASSVKTKKKSGFLKPLPREMVFSDGAVKNCYIM